MSKIRTTTMREPGDDYPPEREASSSDDLQMKVQQAQEVLIDLERRREQIERQKRQLEELRRKQDEFDQGQHEVLELLTRGLVVLERQEHEIKREAEQVQLVRESLAEQLESVEAIQPQQWDSNHLEEELTRALATIDQAKSIYSQAQTRLEAVRRHTGAVTVSAAALEPETSREVTPPDFWAKVTAGFAYSLPGLIGLFLLTLIWLAKK